MPSLSHPKRLAVVPAAISILGAAATATACRDLPTLPPDTHLPASAQIASPPVWGNLNGVSIAGGYGSGVAVDPNEPGIFYILTDRGPNVATPTANTLLFPLPTFNPQIGKFRLDGDSLRLIQMIGLKTSTGVPLSGLPNPAGSGATGEIAVGPGNAPLGTDPEGIDSEGLALAPDGSFWIGDEYGPHIVHFDRTGRTLERINPFGTGTGGRKIPLVFAKRRANRGMEGLAITPNGKTVVGIMQNPLDNPTTTIGRASNVNRIVTFDIATGKVHEYAYVVEANGNYASDIVALDSHTFLVDERDANFPTAAVPGFKRVYKIDLSGATDITDPANGANGKQFNGAFLEAVPNGGLQAAGITPVSKSLVFDLTTIPGGYAPDKFEGLTTISNNILVITNDDDFGVIDNGMVGMMPKILPLTGKQDRMTMYFVKLPTPFK